MFSCNLPAPAVLADDRDLLRAAEAVTREWNGYRNKTESAHKAGHGGLEKTLLQLLSAGTRTLTRPFDHEPGARQTTELSSLPVLTEALPETGRRP